MLQTAKFTAGLAALALLTACNNSLLQSKAVEKPLEVQTVDRIAALNTRLGIGYLREGRNELAFKKLSKALEIQPDYSGAHNAMGILYERLGQPKRAERYFESALATAPQDSAARNNYGGFLCRQGRVDDAVSQFEAAIANPLYKAPYRAMTNAGLCLSNTERKDEAEAYLRRALRLQPKQPSALLAMSELTAATGRQLSARAYLQRYVEQGQHNSRSLWLGVRIERELGDCNAASSYAMLLKAKYPDAKETRLLLESESR